jgi:hypothetical protein
MAIYWRNDRVGNSPLRDLEREVKFSIRTLFDYEIMSSEMLSDSLVVFPFDDSYPLHKSFLLEYWFNDSHPIQSCILNVVSRNAKIEALKSLVETNGSVENLKLLADAYEADQCFVNANYIYFRMIWVNQEKAQKYFNEFYQGNFEILNSNFHPGQR